MGTMVYSLFWVMQDLYHQAFSSPNAGARVWRLNAGLSLESHTLGRLKRLARSRRRRRRGGVGEWTMETVIGDDIGTTTGIHSPFPTKHQTVEEEEEVWGRRLGNRKRPGVDGLLLMFLPC